MLLLATIITPLPLLHFVSSLGVAIWVILLGVTFYLATLAEREKKKFDMQTYHEIVAFMEGTKLDEIEKAREEGKRPYQKLLYAAGAAGITLVISLLLLRLLGF